MKRTLLLTACLAASLASHAQVYSTSFEAPEFVPGALEGQAGWQTTGSVNPAWVVSGDRSSTGTRSLRWSDGNGGAALTAWTSAHPVFNTPTQEIQAGFKLFISNSTSDSRRFGFDVSYNTNSRSRLVIATDGRVHANTSTASGILSQVALLPTPAMQRWISVDLNINFLTRAVIATVDGVQVALPNLGVGTDRIEDFGLHVAYLTPITGDSGLAYFDDYRVAAVPEPAFMTLLALGALVANRRRNKR